MVGKYNGKIQMEHGERYNLHASGILEQEDRENGIEAISEEVIAADVGILMKTSSHNLRSSVNVAQNKYKANHS